MRQVTQFVLISTISLSFAMRANGAVESLFSGLNQLEDQDYEQVLNPPATAGGPWTVQTLTVGTSNYVAGVAEFFRAIDPIGGGSNNFPTTNIFTSVFLLDVSTSTGNGVLDGSNDTITFAPASQSVWDSVYGTGGVLDLGLGASPVSVATGSMIVVYEGIGEATTNVLAGQTNGASAATFVNGGTEIWQFGFTGAGGAPLAEEFWTTVGTDADVIAGAGNRGVTNFFALNLTAPPVVPLDKHNYQGALGNTSFTAPTHLQGVGNFENQRVPGAGFTDAPGWIVTDTDVWINVVPEPMSVAIWGLISTFGGWAGRRAFVHQLRS